MIGWIIFGVISYVFGIFANLFYMHVQAPKVHPTIHLVCATLYPFVWLIDWVTGWFGFLNLNGFADTADKMAIVEEAWPECYKTLLREGKRPRKVT